MMPSFQLNIIFSKYGDFTINDGAEFSASLKVTVKFDVTDNITLLQVFSLIII